MYNVGTSVGHGVTLQMEDEGVASGFSPRALSLHPATTQGTWSSDQLPSTPHKRVGQGGANSHPFSPGGPGLGVFCLTSVSSNSNWSASDQPVPSVTTVHKRTTANVSSSLNSQSPSLVSPSDPGVAQAPEQPPTSNGMTASSSFSSNCGLPVSPLPLGVAYSQSPESGSTSSSMASFIHKRSTAGSISTCTSSGASSTSSATVPSSPVASIASCGSPRPPLPLSHSASFKMQRSMSIPRSPTVTKDISSLSDLEMLPETSPLPPQRNFERHSRLLEKRYIGSALLAFAVVLCIFKGPSIIAFIFSPSFVIFVLNLLLAVLFLALCIVLVRLFNPAVGPPLHLPDRSYVNCNLHLHLQGLRQGLGPALRRGARYLNLASQKDDDKMSRVQFFIGRSSSRLGNSGLPSSRHISPAPTPTSIPSTWQALAGSLSFVGRGSQQTLSNDRTGNGAQVSGCGVHTYANGDRYEGEFFQGKCSGSGVYSFSQTGRYEGDWVEGRYDGYGVETWARGSKYRGQYRQGLREGYGIYRFYTGDVYAGLWSLGQSHGSGMQTCADGGRYIGEFAWGAKHGFGRYMFRNGDVYSGEYFSDKVHGYGVYSFANCHRYEGAWHEGRKQGLGLYTFRNGETRAGYWDRGALEMRSTHSATSASPTAVNHSSVLHAVQEARRASAKAEALPLVNDRVNKAVSGANRSAMAARVAAVKATQNTNVQTIASPLRQAEP
eukprot:TRINITY_DN27340_c0_g1_i1.p1 TRINITY_DN27340_c0_g1~~TRINITY_DN27340_c0_g1_i1.p1  ORF type:complete len:721 (+),score=74.25 TRINITY_DN27340_c0_g1_i1:463-2625(+)